MKTKIFFHSANMYHLSRVIRRIIFCCVWTICICLPTTALSQSGMSYTEFSTKLLFYFEKDIVEDVKKSFPQNIDYKVWGWDIGDFSGDGNNDVACTVRMDNDRSKNVVVYLFTDIDGYLINVAQFPYTFVETPLEVGIVIKNTTCFVTSKSRQFEWAITGYRSTNGLVSTYDEFTTKRIEKLTHETALNYETLRARDTYISNTTNKNTFETTFTVLPSYSRTRQLYKGYTSRASIRSIDFVRNGSFYWNGRDDCSMSVHTAYSDGFLYCTIDVVDEYVVGVPRCDTCPSDYLELWFDTNTYGTAEGNNRRIMTVKGVPTTRTKADTNILKLTFFPGDFINKRPVVTLTTPENTQRTIQQKIAFQQIVKKSGLRPNGYVARLKIPLSLLGITLPNPPTEQMFEIGFTAVIHDIDNEFRPEEKTIMATSTFEPMNPSSFGVLRFIPDTQTFGTVSTIYTDAIIREMRSWGY